MPKRKDFMNYVTGNTKKKGVASKAIKDASSNMKTNTAVSSLLNSKMRGAGSKRGN